MKQREMDIELYREYQIKFYLNARHFIIINGARGETHPHTWEFILDIRFGRSSFTEFHIFEKGISNYLAPFQNQIMNEISPFDEILPTLENMVDYFAGEFYRIIHEIGGILVRVEASETPTRSYVVDLAELGNLMVENKEVENKIMDDAIKAVLDEILKN